MKRILLVLLSLAFLASPALADDTITSWTWSSVTGTFQAKLAALGWKNVPDTVSLPISGNMGGYSATIAYTGKITRVGSLVNVVIYPGTNGTKNGSAGPVTITLPSGFAPATNTYGAANFSVNGNSRGMVLWKVDTSGVLNLFEDLLGSNIAAAQAGVGFNEGASFTWNQ